jgi:hypothetical protein
VRRNVCVNEWFVNGCDLDELVALELRVNGIS